MQKKIVNIKEVIEFLQRFPPESQVYAYEGEITGIIVIDANRNQLGELLAYESEI